MIQPRSHDRVGAQVVDLGEDIFRHGDFRQFVLATGGVVIQHHAAGGFGVVEPVAHQGHGFLEFLEFEEALHGSAVGMAAHDHITDPQGRDRVFNGCALAAVGRAVGGDDIARVAQDKNFPRFRLHNQVRIHPRIRAGDEENPGLLAVGELGEKILVAAEVLALELAQALDELFHGRSRRGLMGADPGGGAGTGFDCPIDRDRRDRGGFHEARSRSGPDRRP